MSNRWDYLFDEQIKTRRDLLDQKTHSKAKHLETVDMIQKDMERLRDEIRELEELKIKVNKKEV